MKFSLFIILLAASLFIAAPIEEKRLIKTSANEPARWMTDGEIMRLYTQNINFMDITDTPNLEKGTARRGGSNLLPAIPTTITHQSTTRDIIALANTDLMKSTLKTLTEFHNRYYKSPTGAASAEWLFNHVKQVVTDSGTKLNVTTSQFKHEWGQHSVIARIEGRNGNEETVVVGAHQDSIYHADRMEGRAPGADDDGSGSVTILEIFRAFLTSNTVPTRPIEFQWYAAEEAGLLGSQAIAQAYKSANRTVAGQMQMDMTGIPNPANPNVAITMDFTDNDLNNLLKSCVTEYSTLKWAEKRCNYGCSDHASWNRAGYASSYPFESSVFVAKNIHTPQDTYDTVSFDHMFEFVKFGLGWLVEMSF